MLSSQWGSHHIYRASNLTRNMMHKKNWAWPWAIPLSLIINRDPRRFQCSSTTRIHPALRLNIAEKCFKRSQTSHAACHSNLHTDPYATTLKTSARYITGLRLVSRKVIVNVFKVLRQPRITPLFWQTKVLAACSDTCWYRAILGIYNCFRFGASTSSDRIEGIVCIIVKDVSSEWGK